MTLQTNLKNYRKYSAADEYIIGFTKEDNLYYVKVKELYPRFLKMMRASTRNGGGLKLQMSITAKQKEQFLKNGAVCLGNAQQLEDSHYNKGVIFEKIVSERVYHIPYGGKDSVGFWKQGDISVNGKEIQVKFQNAQVVTEKTLERLKKGILK